VDDGLVVNAARRLPRSLHRSHGSDSNFCARTPAHLSLRDEAQHGCPRERHGAPALAPSLRKIGRLCWRGTASAPRVYSRSHAHAHTWPVSAAILRKRRFVSMHPMHSSRLIRSLPVTLLPAVLTYV